MNATSVIATYSYEASPGRRDLFDAGFCLAGSGSPRPPAEWPEPRTGHMGTLEYWQEDPAMVARRQRAFRVALLREWDNHISACGMPDVVEWWRVNGLPENPSRETLEWIADSGGRFHTVRVVRARCMQLLEKARKGR